MVTLYVVLFDRQNDKKERYLLSIIQNISILHMKSIWAILHFSSTLLAILPLTTHNEDLCGVGLQEVMHARQCLHLSPLRLLVALFQDMTILKRERLSLYATYTQYDL